MTSTETLNFRIFFFFFSNRYPYPQLSFDFRQKLKVPIGHPPNSAAKFLRYKIFDIFFLKILYVPLNRMAKLKTSITWATHDRRGKRKTI